jgi:probable selenium-dependent hydroxylase accessory protein YqeC
MGIFRERLLPPGGGVVSLVGAGGKTTLMFRLAREIAEAGEKVLTTTTTKILRPIKEQSANLVVSADAQDVIRKAKECLEAHPHLTAAREELVTEGKLIGFDPSAIEEIWAAQLFGWVLVEADGAAGRPLKAPGDQEPVVPLSSSSVIGVVGLDGVGQPLDERSVFRPERFSRISGLALGSRVTEESIAQMIEHEEGLFKECPPEAERIVFLNKAEDNRSGQAGQRIAAMVSEGGTRRIGKIYIGAIENEPPMIERCLPKATP